MPSNPNEYSSNERNETSRAATKIPDLSNLLQDMTAAVLRRSPANEDLYEFLAKYLENRFIKREGKCGPDTSKYTDPNAKVEDSSLLEEIPPVEKEHSGDTSPSGESSIPGGTGGEGPSLTSASKSMSAPSSPRSSAQEIPDIAEPSSKGAEGPADELHPIPIDLNVESEIQNSTETQEVILEQSEYVEQNIEYVEENIEDAEQNIEDAEQNIEDAEQNIEDAEQNIEYVEENIEDAEQNIEDAEQNIEYDTSFQIDEEREFEAEKIDEQAENEEEEQSSEVLFSRGKESTTSEISLQEGKLSVVEFEVTEEPKPVQQEIDLEKEQQQPELFNAELEESKQFDASDVAEEKQLEPSKVQSTSLEKVSIWSQIPELPGTLEADSDASKFVTSFEPMQLESSELQSKGSESEAKVHEVTHEMESEKAKDKTKKLPIHEIIASMSPDDQLNEMMSTIMERCGSLQNPREIKNCIETLRNSGGAFGQQQAVEAFMTHVDIIRKLLNGDIPLSEASGTLTILSAAVVSGILVGYAISKALSRGKTECTQRVAQLLEDIDMECPRKCPPKCPPFYY